MMESDTDELNIWLQEYKEWGDSQPIPNPEVFSTRTVGTYYDTLCNYDFGNGRTIVHTAIERDHQAIITQLMAVLPVEALVDLLDKQEEIDGFTAIHHAGVRNRHEMLKDILNSVRCKGLSPLQLLLKPDEYGWTAAHEAAYDKNREMVLQTILESLTDSDERFQLITTKVGSGHTVLGAALLDNKLNTVMSILSYLTADQVYQIMTDWAQSVVQHDKVYLLQTHIYIVKPLLDLVSDENKINLIETRDSDGSTMKELAQGFRLTEVAELLDDIATEAVIAMTTALYDDVVIKTLLDKLQHQPLTSKQVRELYPHGTNYPIPYNQKNVRQQALIFYNEDDRDGAEEEADNLSESLITAGCDVIKEVWSEVSKLQNMIANHLLQTWDTCSVVILCLMSHGSMGCLQGSDDMLPINNILKQLCDSIPQHVPLVVMIQACQGSRSGIPLQGPQDTDPEVSNFSVTVERAADPPATHMSVSDGDMKIDFRRPHTVLLQATVTGEVAYRGEYTGALADQFRRSNGKISIYDMHQQAVMEIATLYRSEQSPKFTSTLKKNLLLPGPQPQQ